MSLPSEFQVSYLDSLSYPRNLIRNGIKNSAVTLEAYVKRLEATQSELFVQDEEDVRVLVRELHDSTESGVCKENIESMECFDKWFGVKISGIELDPQFRPVKLTREDPKVRFIYIFAPHSRAQLQVTHAMLGKILTYHQVMPEFLDFLFVFGRHSNPRDLWFSGFQSQSTLQTHLPPRGLQIPGRSGQQFQLCYNLKGVTLKSENEDETLHDWSIRQAAIYHQFDVVHGKSTWIVVKGGTDLQQRFKHLTGRAGRPEDKRFDSEADCFRSSLAAHLMFCLWAVEDWRWYVRWLETVVDMRSSMAIHERRGPGHSYQKYEPSDIQRLQHWKERISETAMVLESNREVIMMLKNFYLELSAASGAAGTAVRDCRPDIDSFAAKVSEICGQFNMQIPRVKLLGSIISDRKELVMQHLQGQAADRAEELNIHLEREAALMRIVTIVTLCYLPSTFVSTLFSTDIIKYQDPNGGEPGTGTFSPVALARWFQTTVPLTVVTGLVAYAAYQNAERTRLQRYGRIGEKSTMYLRKIFKLPRIGFIWPRSLFTWKRGKPSTDLPTYNASVEFAGPSKESM